MLDDVTVRSIAAFDMEFADGCNRKTPTVFSIEYAIEKRNAIEIRRAPPIDRTIRANERNASAISESGVLIERKRAGNAFPNLAHGKCRPPVTP